MVRQVGKDEAISAQELKEKNLGMRFQRKYSSETKMMSK
jgi:hypothetical protein